MTGQPPRIPHEIRVPLVVDLIVILALAVQWGSNLKRMEDFEQQIAEIKRAQITEGRIVRIEEQQKYMVERVDETNRLFREYIDEQRQANRAAR